MPVPEPSLSSRQSAAVFVVLFACCFSAAALGGISTAEAVQSWYPSLDRPPWTPPNWAFGPVWTTLYTFMAIAAWDHVRRAPERVAPMALFAVQLALNALWSPLFFGARQTGPALGVIAAMWVTIAGCIVSFWPSTRLGALLLVPYLAWVSVAASLNAWIWWFN